MKALFISLMAVNTAVIIALDCWATAVVARQIDLPNSQRRLQLIFIWLLPLVGATFALRIYRPDEPHEARSSGASDELYPPGIGPENQGLH